jgi:hypothetical protein
MGEIWKDVVGYEGYYQVSSLGNIKGVDRWVSKTVGSDIFFKGKILRQNTTRYGYMEIGLGKGKEGKKYFKVHRLVAEVFIPNPLNLPQVNHINGIKEDNRPENLEWCTAKYNMNHAVEIGLHSDGIGENNVSAVLTENQVREIRASKKYRGYMNDLAAKYGVHKSTISLIVRRIKWKHI